MAFRDMTAGKQARGVLREFRKIAPADRDFWVYPYQNCRERGFLVTTDRHPRIGCAFAEHRNTDEIVIYTGPAEDFEENTGIPSERVYAAKEFVHYGQYAQAAGKVLERLGALEPVAK